MDKKTIEATQTPAICKNEISPLISNSEKKPTKNIDAPTNNKALNPILFFRYSGSSLNFFKSSSFMFF